MKKQLILMILILIPLAYAIPECGRFMQPKDIPCNMISSWKPTAGCSANATIYNSSGDIIQVKEYGDYIPFCNFTFNISEVGTYHYNSTIEDGVTTVDGDDSGMILSITIFLLLINGLVFALPFWVRFSISEAGDYIIKRLVWIASVLLLWFNTTLFRQLASDWNLGIDNFLEVYWWMFTLGAFICVFTMCFVMVVGSTKLMKEAQLRKRLGDNY